MFEATVFFLGFFDEQSSNSIY